jgi:hypothetical protein
LVDVEEGRAMHREFDADRFDLMNVDSVHIPDHHLGHNRYGGLQVWTVRGESGVAFAHRIVDPGEVGPISQGVNALACLFLHERESGRVFFLERDARGFTLQSEDFFGAEAYLGDEAVKVDAWLAAHAQAQPHAAATRDASPGTRELPQR